MTVLNFGRPWPKVIIIQSLGSFSWRTAFRWLNSVWLQKKSCNICVTLDAHDNFSIDRACNSCILLLIEYSRGIVEAACNLVCNKGLTQTKACHLRLITQKLLTMLHLSIENVSHYALNPFFITYCNKIMKIYVSIMGFRKFS